MYIILCLFRSSYRRDAKQDTITRLKLKVWEGNVVLHQGHVRDPDPRLEEERQVCLLLQASRAN